MAKPGTVIGWKLDRGQRNQLLDRFPPRYPDAIADHVTLKADAEAEPVPDSVEAKIIGHADDGDGLEAMVVTINGETGRPDGSVFHITWSLDEAKGREARESNELLSSRQWQAYDEAIPVSLEPARFP